MKFYLPTLKHLVMQLAKLQIYTLNLTTTFWHCKKNPITFEQECRCNTSNGYAKYFAYNMRIWTSAGNLYPFRIIDATFLLVWTRCWKQSSCRRSGTPSAYLTPKQYFQHHQPWLCLLLLFPNIRYTLIQTNFSCHVIEICLTPRDVNGLISTHITLRYSENLLGWSLINDLKSINFSPPVSWNERIRFNTDQYGYIIDTHCWLVLCFSLLSHKRP